MSSIARRLVKRPKAIWTKVPGAKAVPSPAKRVPAKKLRKRLRPVSAGQRGRLADYAKARVRFIARHPVCLAIWPSERAQGYGAVCGRKSEEVHHKSGRRGNLLLDEAKWLAVCPACHRRIHAEPKLAAEMGSIDPSGWRGGA